MVGKAAGTVRLYVDGLLRATTWKIGIGQPGASAYRWAADGAVDGVRIYDWAISDDEVRKLANL